MQDGIASSNSCLSGGRHRRAGSSRSLRFGEADPNHVLTWQYYGLWHIEQGNRGQAQYHLSRIAAICRTDCEEYRSLAAALEKPPGTGLVY
jgi:Flp pilus assembly protein TadD